MPCTFIRLAGCPLRCLYCDTEQAIPTDSGSWMQIDAIVADVQKRGRPLVLVTGGEPLAQRNCIVLLQRLVELGVEVQLETSGAYSVASVPEGVRRIIDIKTPDSGEVERNQLDNLDLLRSGDELKFVICSRSDYEWSRDFIRAHKLGLGEVPPLLSSAWGSVSAEELCAWMLEDHLPARMQLQLHKVIWGAEAKGV
ncbi:7-carboxy-7-deazaguanine synthase [Mariprofundus ferrinatatus]|uniref:7-carboxy-7-deazaguanine synthase n=1 Tax=Mariprofundus ferrinatatus TaxID=1921087 RepID=A0A2K8L7Q0_9PROT|nr:radical SAM protein [Mariprofundus ferrinatatus]ATX81891.1 7-carboxy-7-deazaguanine synthase [Mariprofundus ferrinatatus]